MSDGLVTAFANGTNAAAAFKNSVAEIMQSVIKNIIAVNVVQPALEKLQTYLFGTNGVANDGTLSTSDVEGMVKYFTDIEESISAANDVWDKVESAAANAGINLSTSSSSTGITASEQSLTENTGNILAGYVNDIRLDVAIIKTDYTDIIGVVQGSQTTFSAMLTSLQAIQGTNAQIATNTVAIGELYDFIKNKLAIAGSTYAINVR